MGEYNEEYEDCYYDDGRSEDTGECEREDDYDIPTYDELDLEGRYYTYGSREDYNSWRNEQIREMQNPHSRQHIHAKANNANSNPSSGCATVLVVAIIFLYCIF